MNFFNANARVTVHIKGNKGDLSKSESLDAKEAVAVFESAKIAQAASVRHKKIEEDFRRKEIQEKVILESINRERSLNSQDSMLESGKLLLFKDIMTNIIIEALTVDDEVKPQIQDAVYETVSKYIDDRGGFSILKASARTTNSEFLKNVQKVCENTARKVCKRHLDEDTKTIDFSLNHDEEDEFNYDKQDLNLEELSKMVKDKVLTVVLDEKKREKDELDLLAQLSDEANDGEDIEDVKARTEIDKSPTEESTLFNALMRDSYLQTVSESSNTVNINMDNILLESITKYTIMETFYTVQLENFTVSDIKTKVERLLNKR